MAGEEFNIWRKRRERKDITGDRKKNTSESKNYWRK